MTRSMSTVRSGNRTRALEVDVTACALISKEKVAGAFPTKVTAGLT